MTFSTADLTPLLQSAPTATMRYASGTVVAWNAETFENVIEVRGTQLINLPVLAGTDAITYKEGDVVGLVGADQQGARGITSYAVLGRFVIPGPDKGKAAVEWMTTELGRAIAAAVFADRIHIATAFGDGTNAPAAPNWGNLNDEPGPTVSDVEVTDAGKMIVMLTARIDLPIGGFAQPFMSADVSGPSPRTPNLSRALHFGTPDATGKSMSMRATAVETFTGLAKGTYTVKAQYQGATTIFGTRHLIAIAF